ncbi:MAG: CHRD domain-containing protein, partial [Bacteroidota bacterium]
GTSFAPERCVRRTVPAVTTTAGGMVLTEVMEENSIQVSGSFNNLEGDLATELAGGAHLHAGVAGTNGGIAVLLVPETEDQRTGTFLAASNRFELESDVITQLLNREIYVNVHSQASIPGELRGQLLPESAINFSGFLSSIFEVPEAASRATGAVKAELQGNRLVVSGSFSALSSPVATQILGGAHLHLGYAGQTGSVQFELVTDFNEDLSAGTFYASNNTFELTEEQVQQVRARQFYINIHSQNIPSGELRTQLLFEANSYFVAPLSGASENAPINTDASGMVIVEVNEGNATATGSFAGLSGDLAIEILGGVHFHEGFAGANGGVKELLNTSLNEDNRSGVFVASENTFALSTGLLDTIRQRMIYVNLHSGAVPSGELRGQLLPLATSYFTTTLSGINENSPLSTTANGALKLELAGNQLTVTGRFDDLQGTFASDIAGGAHLHLGQVSELGGLEVLLNTSVDDDQLGGTYLAADNTFTLTEEQLDALFEAKLYANIHSAFALSGELRGQILPEINRFPQGELNIISPADGAIILLDRNEEPSFTVTWEAASDRDPIAYIWQLSTDREFNNILFQTYTTNAFFSTESVAVDELLANAGVAEGVSTRLYHRAIATDGALQTQGPTSLVRVRRGGVAEQNIDLELSISTPNDTYDIFTKIPYQIVVTNTGTQDATNVRIFAGRPEGIVHTSATTTNGIYRLVIERWDIDLLPAGQSDTLD